MRITSLNVNGINAAKKNGLLEFIAAENADILCLQEVKANEATINPDLLAINDYTAFMFYSKKKGHHGTACYSRITPIRVNNGIDDPEVDEEGRVITMEFDSFYLVNAYVPNAGRGLPRLEYKLKFNVIFLNYCEKLRAQKNLIVCGDLNVAHEEIDIANPKHNERNAGFTIEERESFSAFLAAGYIDTFREFVTEGGHYTWWSQRSDAKERNIGWRLDYFVINSEFRPAVVNSEILRDIEVADHCPVRLTIDLPIT
ncbi:MAG TPA: exodeoxyribonuclease III [Candidatus Lokiarchaeia archaeon]|nr:exodeoxyribonuclease III [Candidatus Lokiarchaeia archaeon]